MKDELKSIGLLLLTLVMFLSVVNIGVVANNIQPSLIVSNVSAKNGSTLELMVSLKNNPGIASVKINISYNSEVFTLSNVKNGEALDDSSFNFSDDFSAEPYSVYWNGASDNYNDGVLATFTFQVSNNAQSGIYPITLSYDSDSAFDCDLNDVEFSIIDGSVEICERTSGDANNDNEVNLKDVLVIRRWLSGGWDIDIDDSNADVNFDNAVDLKDVVILRRYLSGGWDIDLDAFAPDIQEPETDTVKTEQFVYGTSENGRDLICYSFTPKNYNRTVLLNFAIHGFEDDYDADGQVLVDAANELIEYYSEFEELDDEIVNTL